MMKNKILTILLSLAIAFGLWIYVITVEQPESETTYYNIPVVLQNESILTERGLMITSERPSVTLHLSSTRTNLNQLNENNIMPQAFDPRVGPAVAKAVAEAARATGVARI